MTPLFQSNLYKHRHSLSNSRQSKAEPNVLCSAGLQPDIFSPALLPGEPKPLICTTDSSVPKITYSNSLEVLLQALFATLPLKGSDCQVHDSPLKGKLSSAAQEGHHTILGGLGRLLCLLCHVAQLPGQRAPVHGPARTGSNTDHLLTMIQ